MMVRSLVGARRNWATAAFVACTAATLVAATEGSAMAEPAEWNTPTVLRRMSHAGELAGAARAMGLSKPA